MLFADIPGQKMVKQQLIKRLRAGNPPHAQLFIGPEGCGSLPMALAYAQYANCLNQGETDSCMQCNSCMKASKFVHPDINFTFPIFGAKAVSTDFYSEWREALLSNPFQTENEWMQSLNAENKQGNITKDECQEFIRKANLKAFEGKYKVFIIWAAEKLKKEGNRLLKTIEEPPPNTLIVLIAEEEEKILQTVLSRTQLVKLSPFQDEEIAAYLTQVKQFSAEESKQLAFISDGNLSKAIQMSGAAVNQNSEAVMQWLSICKSQNVIQINNWVVDFAKSGRENQKSFLEYSLHFLRQNLLLKVGTMELVRLTEREKEYGPAIFQTMHMDGFERLSDLFNKAYFYMERNVNAKLLFFNLSIQLMNQLNR